MTRAEQVRTGIPSVTVVVPCYNYGHLLPGCLDSILRQPGVDVVAHVIDDASPDGSGAVAETIAASDPRIRVTVHKQNQGHIRTYNEGLTAADTDYVVLLSADDLLAPGALGRATRLMEAHPRVGFVYGFSRYFDGQPPRPRRAPARARVEPGPRWIERRLRKATNTISSPEVVVRTSVQHAAGGYRTDLPHAGDLEMWLRLAAHGDVGIVTGPDQAYYRVHQASMSRTSFAAELSDLQQRHAAFEVFLAEPGESVPDKDAAARTMARVLARTALWRAARLRMGGGDAGTADAMADWALSVAPEAKDSPEHRALEQAALRGRGALKDPAVAVLAVRRRAAVQWFWFSRRWRGV
ncbi:MAG TPA: glycosyltransferase family 2 protein [Mycobacteriales bacterium]|nr:glycosyltransferase family 2 protein [Mycobacteriales bacterium]